MKTHAVVLLSVLVAGCASSAPTAPAPVSRAAGTYDGTWTGSTEQGQPVTFSISDNQIKSLNFEFSFSGDDSCPRSGSGGFGGGGSFAQIAGGAFSIVSPSTTAGQLRCVVTGAFVSSTLARGLVEVTVPGPVASTPSCPAAVKAAWVADKS
jgi:lipocalin